MSLPSLAPSSPIKDCYPVPSPSESSSNLVCCTSPEECPICLDEFTSGRAIFVAECTHKFHFSCILQNINHDEANADKCPICRKQQKEWPENTSGISKTHPYCTNCGKRGDLSPYCDACGTPSAHTPTAQEQARMAAAAASRNNIIVECPTCHIRCLVNMHARGTLQCPNGHLFQVRMPQNFFNNTVPPTEDEERFSPTPSIIRQCPTCYTRIQMPAHGEAGQYMCPRGHTFYYTPPT